MSTTDTTIVDVGTPPTTTTAIGNPSCYPAEDCGMPTTGTGSGAMVFIAVVFTLVGYTMHRIGVMNSTPPRAKRTDYTIPPHIRNRPIYCRRQYR